MLKEECECGHDEQPPDEHQEPTTPHRYRTAAQPREKDGEEHGDRSTPDEPDPIVDASQGH